MSNPAEPRLPYRVELRRKFPALARRADSGSPLAAIKLACLECEEGTFNAVSACQDRGCPLYAYRLGHRPKKGAKDPALVGIFPPKFQRKGVGQGNPLHPTPGAGTEAANP